MLRARPKQCEWMRAERTSTFRAIGNRCNGETMMLEFTKGSAPVGGRLALAATWEAKNGEAEAVADILRRMATAVKSEPGTLLFWPHRSSSNDHVFFLY